MYFFPPVDELAQPFPFEPAQFRADLVDGRCYHSRVGRRLAGAFRRGQSGRGAVGHTGRVSEAGRSAWQA